MSVPDFRCSKTYKRLNDCYPMHSLLGQGICPWRPSVKRLATYIVVACLRRREGKWIMDSRPRRKNIGFSMPGYRYWGPGRSGPGAPTNDVDACCKLHDDCYRRFGPSRRCDHLFLNCLQPKIHPYSRTGRHAKLFYNFFRLKDIFRLY